MSFQLSILKILAGQPDGRASVELVKQYLSVFYVSGSEWSDRMKRLAERVPGLNIFSQKLIVRDPGEWRITDDGRALLASLEAPPSDDAVQLATVVRTSDEAPIKRAQAMPPPRRSGNKPGRRKRGRDRRLA